MSGLDPEHPAPRFVVDEQGRFHQLGPSDAEIRLECVKLVCAHVRRNAIEPLIPPEAVAEHAGILADFVLGTAPERPALSEVSRRVLRDEMRGLSTRAAHDEEAAQAALLRDADLAERWAKAAIIQRDAAEQIARDLGEASPP